MIELQQILRGEVGLSVRAKLNTLFHDIIDGKEGINAIQDTLRSFSTTIKTLSGVTDEKYDELREQVLKSFDYTDTSTADLLVYINGMNGGVSGFAIDTTFNPDFSLEKPVTVLAGQKGTYTHFLDESGTPITITQEGVTIFYRGINSTYWKYKTIPIEVNVQRELLNALTSLEVLGTLSWNDSIPIVREGKAYSGRVGALPKAFRENTMPGNVIEDNSIPEGKLMDGAVSTSALADEAITFKKISSSLKTSLEGTITIDQMSSYFEDNAIQVILSQTPCTFRVTYESFSVGSLRVFSDSMGHVITQIFDTHYKFDYNTGEFNFSLHSDDIVYSCVRSYDVTKGSWTPWRLYNERVIPLSEEAYEELKNSGALNENCFYATYEED